MSTGDITARVQRGADLLDEKRPGWWREIDAEGLDIESKCGCVLGQLGDKTYPCFTPAEMYVSGLYIARIDDDIRAQAHGFDAEANVDDLADSVGDEAASRIVSEEFAALTAAWRDLITARREMAGVTS